MIGRLLTKLGVTSTTITGVVYLDVVPSNSVGVKSKVENKEITEDLKTFEDIELFERRYGCNFVFVNSWDEKLLYSARAFYEMKKSQKNEQEKWKNAMIEVLKKADNSGKAEAKEFCKTQKNVITLFDNQTEKTFRLGEPDNKKW